MNKETILKKIADFEGIIQQYYDVWGNLKKAKTEVIEELLRVLGYPVENPSALMEKYELKRAETEERIIDPVVFIKGVFGRKIIIRIPQRSSLTERTISLRIADETSTKLLQVDNDVSALEPISTAGTQSGNLGIYEIEINTSLPIGYYKLEVELDDIITESRLVVCPETAYMPERLRQKKGWGVGINLFEINSSENQGIGDLSDLKKIVNWVGKELGGQFVAVNPFHHTTNRYPYGVSPYSPISRLYSNPIYISLNRADDMYISSISALEEFDKVKSYSYIDYDQIYEKKMKLLKKAFLNFHKNHLCKKTQWAEIFLDYIKQEGRDLHYHALFMAINEYFCKANIHGWKSWPDEYKHPEAESIKVFEESHQKDILFQKYLQWLFNQQLKAVENTALASGLEIGLCRDLAIGSLEQGSDVWANQHLFVRDCSVGAPPDAFSPLGQNWGFPPLSPRALKEDRYDFFIKLIRKNIAHAGALRIDHALGLFRLFWIPPGASPSDGVYVRYPAEELLSIIALESNLNKTIIIAEDLGTVAEEVREKLRRFNMLSFRVLYFEKDYSNGEFLQPEAYPELAIVSTTTHDLPTLSGFWIGRDIKIKKQLNRYPDQDALETDLRERHYDRWRLLRALNNAGVLPDEIDLNPDKTEHMTDELVLAIYRFLAMTPSILMQVYLNDLIGVTDQTNLPGTINEYPNWRLRHCLSLEEIFGLEVFKKLKKLRP